MFAHAKCTNPTTTEILLTEFNSAQEVRHDTQKLVPADRRAQLYSKKHSRAAGLSPAGHGLYITNL
jgi:hypothetical protein